MKSFVVSLLLLLLLSCPWLCTAAKEEEKATALLKLSHEIHGRIGVPMLYARQAPSATSNPITASPSSQPSPSSSSSATSSPQSPSPSPDPTSEAPTPSRTSAPSPVITNAPSETVVITRTGENGAPTVIVTVTNRPNGQGNVNTRDPKATTTGVPAPDSEAGDTTRKSSSTSVIIGLSVGGAAIVIAGVGIFVFRKLGLQPSKRFRGRLADLDAPGVSPTPTQPSSPSTSPVPGTQDRDKRFLHDTLHVSQSPSVTPFGAPVSAQPQEAYVPYDYAYAPPYATAAPHSTAGYDAYAPGHGPYTAYQGYDTPSQPRY
ncbi:hypothetical protein SpCBS45565_g05911 [Spizellomyces sp. 'palustris']|nr:hypothetical protein SpCBS45565_g05911 [Spizellomyces sp. 'palustris']